MINFAPVKRKLSGFPETVKSFRTHIPSRNVRDFLFKGDGCSSSLLSSLSSYLVTLLFVFHDIFQRVLQLFQLLLIEDVAAADKGAKG